MTTQSVEAKHDSHQQDARSSDDHHDERDKDLVRITVNDQPVEIHRGRQLVRDIKKLGHVPPADELAQVVQGHAPMPLPDDGSVVIKGGEEFISYPKDSGSSHSDFQPVG
jgi:hypothetical protein